jgi:tetratricopeptide (TPR) repeat protein
MLDLEEWGLESWIRTKMWAAPLRLLEAQAREAMGDTLGARVPYQEAAALLEVETRAHPYDPRFHASLGEAYAGLDRKEEAMREADRAVELLPLSADAFYGLSYAADRAAGLARLGEADAAISQVEDLLEIPSWYSPAWLEREYRLDPIRDHPGFQALLARYRGPLPE